MRFSTRELATAVAGRLAGADVAVDGVATDSRALPAGSLFVPLVAARDGHDFIGAALDAGAAAYLTAREPQPGRRQSAVVVADTLAALGAIGRHARDRLPDRVVGITGSVGKTSVKDLTAGALGAHAPVAAAPRSFNNDIGVPVTLAGAPDDAWAAVVEMGARGPGEISALCALARPTVAVVTAVAPAHTARFGSLDDVAAAKRELVEALPAGGTAVLNASDPRVLAMAGAARGTVITFGVDIGDVAACDVTLDAELRPSCTLRTPSGSARVTLEARGAHRAANAAAAAAASLALGVPLAAIVAGLHRARLSPQRMDVRRAASGAIVIDDAYNANPASVAAALRALAQLDAARVTGRRVAVLGVMAELGADAPARHRAVTELARELGVELVALDAPYYDAATSVATIDEALSVLGRLSAGDAVLVKGSRVAALERVVARLLG